MRGGRFVAACLAATVSLALSSATRASAAPVMVLEPDGHAVVRDDPFVPAASLTSAPSVPTGARAASAAGRRAARARHGAPTPTVAGTLTKLWRAGAISTSTYRGYGSTLTAATSALRRLRGLRAIELSAVLANLHQIAADGLLSASRSPALFLTLESNRRWWTQGPLLNPAQRVELAGSELVWQYYPGQGIEIQELGSFGKADGLFTGGRANYARMRHLLAELIALVSMRGGGLAWEYFFRFEAGVPPWTSAMSQATALEALSDAYRAFGDPGYLALARRALPIFGQRPPAGVSVPTRRGLRYLLYSFAPGEAVINGFLQSLIGLYDFWRTSGDARAGRLFAAGDAEARAELPSYDTGAWSLYEPGQESDLNYHALVTEFLHELCNRVRAPAYCATALRFDAYMKTPPALRLLTLRVRARGPSGLRFTVSKVSHVGIIVTSARHTVLLTSAQFGRGIHAFGLPGLAPGSYAVRLAATDLAGNFSRSTWTLQVSP
ncbi:MAG: hypothetical protein JO179_11565 [Solirubrobacterales bacterium]|nr:hypothetical protein [Solirubrobacterales bacterium]